MKTYKMLGGGVVKGNKPLEVIKRIREYSFNPGDTLTEYMALTAAACRLYSSVKISVRNYQEFIDSLVEHGFLIEGDNENG